MEVIADNIGKKLEQEEVKYADATDPAHSCDVCLFFIEPGACEYVKGPIHPNGVCSIWQPADDGGQDLERSLGL